ncbi:hypothetical protein CN221_28380, partial [Sinorhizobium meliloti]
ERPSGRATPSLRDAPGDAPIQIDAVPKLIVAPHRRFRRVSLRTDGLARHRNLHVMRRRNGPKIRQRRRPG